ncbi:hypothetical protein [Rhizobium leguminosarum]
MVRRLSLEHFRFSPNHGNALSLCFHAILGKSVSRFAWQNRYALLLELLWAGCVSSARSFGAFGPKRTSVKKSLTKIARRIGGIRHRHDHRSVHGAKFVGTDLLRNLLMR